MNSIGIFLQTLLLGAGLVAALAYFGFGAAWLLLPADLREWRGPIMPLTGAALIIVWDYIALFFGFNLTVATVILLVAVTVMNAVLLRRALRTGWRPAPQRTQWILFGIALFGFVLAVAPLWRYGYNTLIGENWDYEFYLPLADWLRDLPTAALSQAPSNPLMNVVLSRHILPLPMGFSYLQSSLDLLFGLQAFDSMTVLMGVLRALAIVSPFILFRAALKMTNRAALVAVALLACNGLLLWVTYWDYGLHLTSLALLPVALVLGAHALDSRDPRALPLAALFLAALNVTFHPALVFALVPLGLFGLYLLAARSARVKMLAQGAALVGGAALLSFPTLFHLPDFLREYYGREPLAAGLRAFVPVTDAYGLSQYTVDLVVGHAIPTPALYLLATRVWDVAAPLLFVLAVAASLFALWQIRTDRERAPFWFILAGASLIYMLLFRLPMLRPYPYGFLKSLTLVSFVWIALAVEGLFFIRKQTVHYQNSPARKSIGNSLLGLAALAASLLILFSGFITLEQYFKPAPVFFSADDLRVRDLASVLPRGASVWLTNRVQVQKVPMALAAYALREHPLRGAVFTGYGDLRNEQPGRVYDYGLLARGEDPLSRGYAAEALWENDKFALFPRQPGVSFHRNLSVPISPGGRQVLTVGDSQIVSGTAELSGAARADVKLGLAAFSPAVVRVSLGGQADDVDLQPGLSLYSIPNLALPAQLTLVQQGEGPQPVYLAWVQEKTPAGGERGLAANATALLLKCANGDAATLDVNCAVANPAGARLDWEYVVRGTPKGTREEQLLIRQQVLASPRQNIGISFEPRDDRLGFSIDAAAPEWMRP
ncbi:MAG: hypothetical protein ACM3JD_02410, partial [Rudaea sp.]